MQQIREIKLVSIIFKSGPTTSQRKRVGGWLAVVSGFDCFFFAVLAFVCRAACAGQITF